MCWAWMFIEYTPQSPKDEESITILQAIFKKYGIDAQINDRIFPCSRKDNWWQRGNAVGELGGPDSEIFYYLGDDNPQGKSPADFQDDFLEIGNSVFMQYRKADDNIWEELQQKNVDFGGGLERIALCVQQQKDIFRTDNFLPIIEEIERLSAQKYASSPDVTKAMRVIADHMRAAVFLAMDGVYPSNKDQGYILRRLIRRMVRYSKMLNIDKDVSPAITPTVIHMLSWLYPELEKSTGSFQKIFSDEEHTFKRNIENAARFVPRKDIESAGLEEIADIAFNLYQSNGFPPELFIEEIKLDDLGFTEGDFYKLFSEKFKQHQKISNKGAESKFKGGLADHSEQTVKYHTATHLLHQALCDIVGTDIRQIGSNITDVRLRFDFSTEQNVTNDDIKKVESIVNNKIKEALTIHNAILPKDKALGLGAKAFFKQKYPDTVKIYFVGDKDPKNAYSLELCGGPHVSNTSDIGLISIFKFQPIGSNSYRIYAKSCNNVL